MSRPGFRKTSVVIVILLSPVLLVALVALVGDIVAKPSITRLSDESLQHFSQFREVGYRKPAYYSDMKDGEAWDMYARSADALECSDKGEIKFITQDFMRGTNPDSAKAALILAGNDSIIVYVKEGVHRTKSTTPFNYEEGYRARLPDYTALRTAARLMACRARLALSKDPQSAIGDMIDGAVFAQDMAGGDLTFIGHMIGVVCLSMSANEIHRALTQFYLGKSQLDRLASVMNTLANTWPPLSRNLDANWRTMAISFTKLRFQEIQEVITLRPKGTPNQFFYWWISHLLSWRSLFSFRRAQLGAINFQKRMAQDLAEAELRGWSAVDSTVGIWGGKMIDSHNWVVQVLTPSMLNQYRRRAEGIAYVRLAGAGALLQIYFLKTGHWPNSLKSVKTDGLEDLLVDPMTGGALKYVVYPGADSVALYSVGTNMLDDGGVKEPALWDGSDLVLILHSPKGF